MNLTTLLQASEIVEVLQIKNVTIIGLLLVIIAILIYDKTRIEKKHEKEKAIASEKIAVAYQKLADEYKSSNIEIKAMTEKYYIIATKVLERLKSKL